MSPKADKRKRRRKIEDSEDSEERLSDQDSDDSEESEEEVKRRSKKKKKQKKKRIASNGSAPHGLSPDSDNEAGKNTSKNKKRSTINIDKNTLNKRIMGSQMSSNQQFSSVPQQTA